MYSRVLLLTQLRLNHNKLVAPRRSIRDFSCTLFVPTQKSSNNNNNNYNQKMLIKGIQKYNLISFLVEIQKARLQNAEFG